MRQNTLQNNKGEGGDHREFRVCKGSVSHGLRDMLLQVEVDMSARLEDS